MDTRKAVKAERDWRSVAGTAGDYWLFHNEFHTFVEAVRREERERAAKIVEEWPVESSYVVGKIRLQNRRADIARAIRGTP